MAGGAAVTSVRVELVDGNSIPVVGYVSATGNIGSVVADSGYVGLNSLTNYNNLIAAGVDPEDINLVFPYNGLVNNGNGSLRFKKLDSTIDTAEIIVSSPLSTSTWIINKVDPYLTPFYIGLGIVHIVTSIM